MADQIHGVEERSSICEVKGDFYLESQQSKVLFGSDHLRG
jgi:hypothetical protein